MIAIPTTFILGTTDAPNKTSYVIAPPEHRPEYTGYVLYAPEDTVTFFGGYIFLFHGNFKDNCGCSYMFEHATKIEGHPFFRYRFTEKQMGAMYETENVSILNYAKNITFNAIRDNFLPTKEMRAAFDDEQFYEILRYIIKNRQ